MKPSSEIIGNKILILGYGREGESVHRYLRIAYPDAIIAIADVKPVRPIAPIARQYVGPDYLSFTQAYSTIIRSPGVPIHHKELQKYLSGGGHITTAMNIFFSLCPGMTIGVTGTKGKSTTSALIAHILNNKYPDVRLVGNIGSPALDQLSGANKNTIFVIELSSHMLEDIRYSPHIAVILDISQEHLDYYPTFDHYTAAKAHIVAYQKNSDYVVYNPDHPLSAKIAATSEGQNIIFSLKKSDLLPDDLQIKGEGNRENALAAATVADILKISAEEIKSALSSFKPLPHRLEFVGEVRGIRFYNDSLATTPEAVMHALSALGEDVSTLIAGGFDRGLDYTELGKYLAGLKNLKTLILFPDTGVKIWEAYQKAGGEGLQKFDVSSMGEAVKLTFAQTPSGKICLLSPGAASFNLFKNYADRGEKFKNFIRNWAVGLAPT